MAEPDRTLLVLLEIRADLRRMQGRMDFEFSEIRDRLQRLDERVDGFFIRVERLEGELEARVAALEERQTT